MIRSILREFGHLLPTGIEAVSKFAREHGTEDQLDMPEIADVSDVSTRGTDLRFS